MDKKLALRKIDRTIKSGDIAYIKLKEVSNLLNSARRWGLLDIVKGKYLTTFIKQRKLRQAERVSIDAEKAVREFAYNLTEVSEFVDIEIGMSTSYVFLDYFLDNPIVDILVQGQINNNRRKIEEALRDVQRDIDKLKKEKIKIMKYL